VDISSKRIAICAGALAISLAAPCAGSAQEADGKQLYLTRTCVACHGRNGAKAIQSYPQLAGLDQGYLFQQMKDIAEGKRVSGPDARGFPRTEAMKAVMGVVTYDELKTIAAWLATLPPPPIVQGDATKIAQGAIAFANSGCPACHGDGGSKPLEGFPIVAGQKKDYLLLQIKEIRDGVRSNDKADLMKTVVEGLSDADAEAIAEYLSSTARTMTK
jgi:cytochrome c553